MKTISLVVIFSFIAATVVYALPANKKAMSDVKSEWKRKHSNEKVLKVAPYSKSFQRKVLRNGVYIMEHGVPLKVLVLQKKLKRQFNITALYECNLDKSGCVYNGHSVGESTLFAPEGLKQPSKKKIAKMLKSNLEKEFKWCKVPFKKVQGPVTVAEVNYDKNPEFKAPGGKFSYNYFLNVQLDDANKNRWNVQTLLLTVQSTDNGKSWKYKNLTRTTAAKSGSFEVDLQKKGKSQKCSASAKDTAKGLMKKVKLPW